MSQELKNRGSNGRFSNSFLPDVESIIQNAVRRNNILFGKFHVEKFGRNKAMDGVFSTELFFDVEIEYT